MMALYLLGTVMALIVSYVMKWFIKISEKSFFILELPRFVRIRYALDQGSILSPVSGPRGD